MSKLVATTECTLKITTPGVTASGMHITTPPSVVSFVKGAGIYKGDITVLIPSATYGSYTATGISITISPSSEKSTTRGDVPIVEKDKGSKAVTFTDSEENTTVVVVEVQVDEAGQNVVKVN